MFGSRTTTHSSYERVADKVYTWRSVDKNFFYYDKESQERVPLPKGAKLIPLTATNSVTGVHTINSGKATSRYNQIYSNEFVSYKDEIVRVYESDRLDDTRTLLYEGVYSPTIREAISSVPYCKFTKNIYCLLDGEVVKVSLSGSSLNSWIEFEDKLKKSHTFLTDGHYFTLSGAEERKTGSVNYNAPIFELGDISAEEDEEADKIAAEVEEKLTRNRAAASGEAPAQIATETAPQASSKDSDNKETINLEEIPF